jgi:hypothetical protein
MASIDPCSLLSTSQASGLGLETPGTEDTTGTARDCEYNGSAFGATVGVRTDGGLSALSGATSLTIGSHQAGLQDHGAAGCFIAIGVTSSSRAEVVTTSNSDASSCTDAKNVAQLIEPNLPTS